MKLSKRFLLGTAAAVGCAALLASPTYLIAQNTVTIDADDIGGVVTGPNGPEAGVWVIAETQATCRPASPRWSSPTIRAATSCPICRRRKYKVWVRGYGLVDSAKVDGEPGKQLNLHAVPAPNEAAAAALLPGDLLVLDAEDPGRRTSSAARATFPRRSSRSTGST